MAAVLYNVVYMGYIPLYFYDNMKADLHDAGVAESTPATKLKECKLKSCRPRSLEYAI